MVDGTVLYSLVAFWTMLLAPKPEPRLGPVTPTSVVTADSAAAHALLVLNISEFQVAWQRAWQEVEANRMKLKGSGIGDLQKWSLVHCHPDGELEGVVPEVKNVKDSIRKVSALNTVIRSRNSWYAVCPSWMLDPSEDAQERPGGRDGVLTESVKRRVAGLRVRLVDKLVQASTQSPNDGWLWGQVIRFRLDQGDLDGALATARTCGAEPWWCEALLGYVQSRSGDRAAADSAYLRMEDKMTPQQRCRWDDVSVFGSQVEQKAYTAQSCTAQSQFNAQLWWLSDPLFRVAGNERLTEQQSRRVEVAIRSSLAQDEWHPWFDQYGGDALQTLTLRYGSPSHYTWFGDTLDLSHTTGYLELRGTVGSPPYTTFEYPADRVHVLPSWSAALLPFATPLTSWSLSVHDSVSGAIAGDWWPLEHFKPLRPLVQFRETQVALFRRQSQAIVATASTTKDAALPANAVFDVMMLSSIGPTAHVDSLAQVAMKPGPILAMRALVPVTPAIISIEGLGANGAGIDVRTRFGITPPPPLDSMREGELELSDIAFLDTKGDSVKITEPDESLLDHMSSSLHLDANHRRIGLYWESYGVSATDVVSVTVRVGTVVEISTLQRIGMAFRISSDPNSSITQAWSEPDANRGTKTLEGLIPVQQRTLALNLSQLPAGDYALEISMQRPGGKIASKTRRFTIDK
ncbi:MAG: hypothetical protein ABJB74_19990 [Gemmatimonas sp.]